MSESLESPYASRSGYKLAAALDDFVIDPSGWTSPIWATTSGALSMCSSVEERAGCTRSTRVMVCSPTDCARMRQHRRHGTHERHARRAARIGRSRYHRCGLDATTAHRSRRERLLKPGGRIITLIKPHYEADKTLLDSGVLPSEHVGLTVESVLEIDSLPGNRSDFDG